MSGLGSLNDVYNHPVVEMRGISPLNPAEECDGVPKGAGFIQETGAAYYWEALVQLSMGDEEAAKRAVRCVESGSFSCPRDELRGLQRLFGDAMSKELNSAEAADRWLVTSMGRCGDWPVLSEPCELYALGLLCKAWDNPNFLAVLGVGESEGIDFHQNYLTREDLLTYQERRKRLAGLISRLEDCPNPANLRDRYNLISLQFMAEGELNDIELLRWKYPFEQMGGVHIELQELFLTVYPLNTDRDADAYVRRLEQIPGVLEGALQRFEKAAVEGILPPQIVLLKVIKQLKELLPEDPSEHVLVHHLRVNDVKEKYCQQANQIIEKEVYPALRKCKEVLSKLFMQAPEESQIGQCLDGRRYYEHSLYYHTSLPVIPSEVTELGLREVDRIQSAMLECLTELGFEKGSLAERLHAFAASDTNYFENTEEGRQLCLGTYAMIMERARSELWPLFGRTPKAFVEMCRVPESMEQGMPAAYYWPPSVDGSRPGRFFVNLRDMGEQAKYGMETLAVHEAEPGHHFQLSIQAESELPLVLKGFHDCFNAYVEGWALYTERLAAERGFFSSTSSELGHLRDEMLRAVRLVVDTKLHTGQFTREEAIAYMMAYTGMSQKEVETEVDRYLVLPGQACSYKLGQMEILEQRQQFLSKKGNSEASIREFHDLLLGLGAVPMTTLIAAVFEATLSD